MNMESLRRWLSNLGPGGDVVARSPTPKLMVTLCPSFTHFDRFANDRRLIGIRLNSAMLDAQQVATEIELAKDKPVPLWFDVKGRQLRVTEVLDNPDYLDFRINHPISVNTPTPVLLKAGADEGLLGHILEGGHRLLFSGNPTYTLQPGESICIRDPSLVIKGPLFVEAELEKIELVKAAGINKWFVSYVEEQRDIDIFRELVGQEAELNLKIESPKGVEFATNHFRKDEVTRLVAACGDLYVELAKPHEIYEALRAIIKADQDAIMASRMLLSIVQSPVPSMADFTQLAWCYDQGYRTFMLCDELCLDGDMLAAASNVFEAFQDEYKGTAA